MAETRVCVRCGIDRDITDFYERRDTQGGYDPWCKPCKVLRSLTAQAWARLDALEALGGCCTECGITDLRVLVIDHRDGGGKADRKRFGNPGAFYRHVATHPGAYQALCHNCNHLKRLAEGEHRRSGKYRDLYASLPPFDRPASQSEHLTRLWADPQYREKQSAGRSAAWTDERREAASARTEQARQQILANTERNRARWSDGPGGWHEQYPACLGCERTDRKHKGLGLCTACHKTIYRKPRRQAM